MVTVQSTKYPTNITETNGINDSAFFFALYKRAMKDGQKVLPMVISVSGTSLAFG